MQPTFHPNARDLKSRLDLIAKRIDVSIKEPQKTRSNQAYMLKDLAHEIIRGTDMDDRNTMAQYEPIRRVFFWVKQNIEYRGDPADYDYYMSAGRTIQSGAGDCDDFVILTNALLSSVGYTTGARVISPNGAGWHIYSIVGVNPAFNGIPTQVVPVDASIRNPGAPDIGWEPPSQYRRFERQCTFRSGRVVGYTTVRNG